MNKQNHLFIHSVWKVLHCHNYPLQQLESLQLYYTHCSLPDTAERYGKCINISTKVFIFNFMLQKSGVLFGLFCGFSFENCYLPFYAPWVMRIRPSARTNIQFKFYGSWVHLHTSGHVFYDITRARIVGTGLHSTAEK